MALVLFGSDGTLGVTGTFGTPPGPTIDFTATTFTPVGGGPTNISIDFQVNAPPISFGGSFDGVINQGLGGALPMSGLAGTNDLITSPPDTLQIGGMANYNDTTILQIGDSFLPPST
jgi:hypothetical protein